MKKVALAVLLAGGMVSGVALADEHSVSVVMRRAKYKTLKTFGASIYSTVMSGIRQLA